MRIAQFFQDQALAFIQGIEAHKNVLAGLYQVPDGGPGLDLIGQGPVHHAFIGHVLGTQGGFEIGVQREKEVPELQETGFHDIGLQDTPAVPEMGQELLDGGFLSFAQVFKTVLDGPEVRHIPEQGFRIYKVFVHIVEVAYHHFSPEDEFVQRFGFGIQGLVLLIEFQQQAQAVAYFPFAIQMAEKVADGVHGRNHHGHATLHQGSQVLPEENHGAPVGENETSISYFRAGKIMRRHLFKKRHHISCENTKNS